MVVDGMVSQARAQGHTHRPTLTTAGTRGKKASFKKTREGSDKSVPDGGMNRAEVTHVGDGC